MAMLLSKEHAKAIKLPTEVWFEEIGGLEGTRYRAEKMIAFKKDDEAMYFLRGSGRAWDGYNKRYCGWRLWLGKPTLEEQLDESWIWR